MAIMALVGMIVWHYRMPVMNLMPPCSFRIVTGLYCPGCGGRRSVAALGKGEFLTALRMNLLVYPLAIFLLWVMVQLLRSEWSQSKYHSADISARTGWVICWFVLAFWILRNIPIWPFTLLAPW